MAETAIETRAEKRARAIESGTYASLGLAIGIQRACQEWLERPGEADAASIKDIAKAAAIANALLTFHSEDGR